MDFVFHYNKITTITDQSDKFGQGFFKLKLMFIFITPVVKYSYFF